METPAIFLSNLDTQKSNEALPNMETLADVFNSIRDSIIAVSSDGTVQYMNGAASTIFGAEHCFTRMIEQLPDDARAALVSVMVGVLPDYHLSYCFQNEASQPRWMKMTVTPLQGSGGAVIQHHEITPSRQIPETLPEGPVQPLSGMLFQYRRFPDGRHYMPFVSDQITELFGVTPEEVRLDAGAIFEKLHPQDRDGLLTSMNDSAPGESSWQQELRLLLPNQEVRWLQTVSSRQKLTDGSNLWRGFAWDVTEQKLLQLELNKAQADLEMQLLERTQKLSEVNRQLVLLNKEIRGEIKERKKLEKKLKESHDMLLLLAAELNLSQEHERRRIAMALHDEVVQDLALSKLRLDMTLKDGTAPPDVLKPLIDLIEKSILQIRDICHQLGPPLLYDLGLSEAIDSLCERLGRQHGVHFFVQGKLEGIKLPNHMRIVLYQAVRELLVNVVKHAKANRVIVQIRHKLGMIQLTVIDDGVGFSNPEAKGFGLYHLEQRIQSLNGTVRVISAPGKKTVVALVVPIAPFGAKSRLKLPSCSVTSASRSPKQLPADP